MNDGVGIPPAMNAVDADKFQAHTKQMVTSASLMLIFVLTRRETICVTHFAGGGFSARKSASCDGERKFIPTSNEAFIQPKPSVAM